MSEMSPGQGQDAPNPHVRHEISDINIRGVLIIAGCMVIGALVVHLVTWGVFTLLAVPPDKQKLTAPRGSSVTVQERLKKWEKASQPPLEELKRQEGIATEPATGAQLHDYGPANPPEEGFARIPIERAMELLVQQQEQGIEQRGGLDRPTNSNAGRGPVKEGQQ
jgi:hypothetical protein